MTAPEPKSAGQLTKLLRAYVRREGLAEARVRHWVAYMALAGALERADTGTAMFTVRGGVAVELRRAGRARATRDIDLTYTGLASDRVAALEEAIHTPYERFAFRRNCGTEPYPMHVGAVSPGAQAPWNEPPSTADFPNERVQDAVDALLLREIVTDLRALREACVDVFMARDAHPWPPMFDPPAVWVPQFAEMAIDLGLAETELASATLVLRKLVRDVEDARQAE